MPRKRLCLSQSRQDGLGQSNGDNGGDNNGADYGGGGDAGGGGDQSGDDDDDNGSMNVMTPCGCHGDQTDQYISVQNMQCVKDSACTSRAG